jgi:hypothetical protein
MKKRASQFLQRDDYVSNHREREREIERGFRVSGTSTIPGIPHTLSPVS